MRDAGSRRTLGRLARRALRDAGSSDDAGPTSDPRPRSIRCALFVGATAAFAAPAAFESPLLADWFTILAGALVVATAPFSMVRRAIGRSDDVYAALASVGGAAALLGGVVLDDSPLSRTLGALAVLLLAPAIAGPRRPAHSAGARG